ncbi:MAG: AAA family ATPase [Candidatus Aminicenantes bacterium]|nr:AAA family ATPase [Candidatus Aminicenantes bacterium]
MKKEANIIGLTGTNGAGKGEAADFFVRHGFAYHSLSDLIRDELKNQGLESTRNNLIEMGNRLRIKYGADILARRAMEMVKGKTVIDSIRNPDEVSYLQRRNDFLLLAVDAPPEIRYERVTRRGRDESARSLQEFIAKEKVEMTGPDTGQQLERCMEMADFLVTNDGTLDAFHRKLEKFL